jgi:D-tyrosyl-tRNA(Tyr) deacylase
MRLVIQKVTSASVKIEDTVISSIQKGLLIFLAVHKNDTEDIIPKLTDKITKLRIFEDENRKINHSIIDIQGEILIVPQFTLYGDSRKGNRPSFTEASDPEKAEAYYEKFVAALKEKNIPVATGKFRTYMHVQLINDGPVTLIIDF